MARETFEVEIHSLRAQHPYTLDALQQFGKAPAHAHRYTEASELFRDLIDKLSNSKGEDAFSVSYSFACVAEAADRPDDALQYLREPVNRGFKGADGLMAEPDLKGLRSKPKVPATRRRTQTPVRQRSKSSNSGGTPNRPRVRMLNHASTMLSQDAPVGVK